MTQAPFRIVIPALVGATGASIGGTAAHVSSLAPRLRSRGLDVLVLGHGSPEDASPGFHPLFHRANPRGRDLFLALWRRRRQWDFPADTLIHVQRPDHALAFRKGPWPLVVSFRGVHRREVARRGGRVADWIYGRLTSQALDRADALTFVTEYDRREVIGNVGKWTSKSHLLPPGVDFSRFQPGDRLAARRALGLPEDPFGIGYVGRLAPEKNLPALMEALENISDAELWIAGAGPQADALKRRAGPRVRFLGMLRDELPAFYAASDVVALASLFEGLPTVILEAWASGRPVVAPSVTGVSDLLASGGGFLAESPEPASIRAALIRCRETLAHNAPGFSPDDLRDRAAPYDAERITDATIEVYQAARRHRTSLAGSSSA